MDLDNKNTNTNQLLTAIYQGIFKKKGEQILSLDLSKLDHAICNHFVICHAESNRQILAIAESVEEVARDIAGEKPWHKEGFQNAQWILLDYGDVIVHIFQAEYRKFYDLENLWADAEISNIEEQ